MNQRTEAVPSTLLQTVGSSESPLGQRVGFPISSAIWRRDLGPITWRMAVRGVLEEGWEIPSPSQLPTHELSPWGLEGNVAS